MKLNFVERGLEWWSQIVLKHSLLVVLLFIPLFLFAAYLSVFRLGINTDLNDMISDRLDFHRNWINYKEEFPHLTDNFLVVIESDSKLRAREFTRKILPVLKESTSYFEHVAWLNDPDLFHASFFLRSTAEEQEDLVELFSEFQPLILSFAQSPNATGMLRVSSALQEVEQAEIFREQISQIDQGDRARLSYKEFFVDQHLDDPKQYIEIKGILDYSQLLPAQESLYELRRILNAYAEDGVSAGITGQAALSYEELQSVSEGALFSALLSLLLVSLILIWSLRSFRLISLTLLNLITGLVLTAGFAALAVGHLNMISVAFAVLFIGLGVDYSIHLCMRYRDLRKALSRVEAIQKSMTQIGTSLVICTLTTAVGFFAFVPTHYAGVSELGIISGTGMFINLGIHLSLLPALLNLWPDPVVKEVVKVPNPGVWIASLSFSRYRLSLVVVGILFVTSFFLIPQTRFDSNPLHLQNPRTEAYQVYRELLKETKQSPWTVKILASSEEEALQMREELELLPEVGRVLSIHDFFLSEDQKGGPLSKHPWPQLRRDRFQVSESEFSREISFFERAYGETYPNLSAETLNYWQDHLVEPSREFYSELSQLSHGGLETLPEGILSRLVSSNGLYRIEVFPKTDMMDLKEMRAFGEAILAVNPNATDDPITLAFSGDAVVEAFIQATATALVVIFFLLLLLTRSLRQSSIIVIPLIVASALTMAAANLIGMDFNFANIIVIPLLLGIGVDSGVHLMHRFSNSEPGEALSGSTSQAVFFSALTTIGSFGSLSFSFHRGTASMGVLLTFGTLIIMLTTLILIPSLVRWFKATASEDHEFIERRLASGERE